MIVTEFLDLEDALRLCELIGVGPVKDLGLLDSALRRPATSLYGSEAYPLLAAKGAALLESVVCNHALVDGNKRLGWTCLVVFLDLNGEWLEVEDDIAFDAVMALAAGTVTLDSLTALISGWLGQK